MLVKNALEWLNNLPLNAEICAQWYEKEDMEYGDETISNEVWSEANRLMDKWEITDLRYQLDDAIRIAKENLETGKDTGYLNELVSSAEKLIQLTGGNNDNV